jgi:hypothetical protein
MLTLVKLELTVLSAKRRNRDSPRDLSRKTGRQVTCTLPLSFVAIVG